MTPTTQVNLTNDFEFKELPSKTYKINNNRICGFIDNIDAIKQAIYLILNTERYEHIIYSWNYGIELNNLYGKDTNFVVAELQRVITEALTQDDRITDVTDFEFETVKNKVHCTFTVKTIFGDIKMEKSINV